MIVVVVALATAVAGAATTTRRAPVIRAQPAGPVREDNYPNGAGSRFP
jgi:hypothetical protein